jgi:2-dehydro-3-deoxygluconokinase
MKASEGKGIADMGEPMAEFSDMGKGMYGLSFSGDAVNVAISARRLGVKSYVISAVGDDYFGRELKVHLEKEGVKTDSLTVIKDGYTGLYFITLLGGGDHVFTYYRKGSSAGRLVISTSQLDRIRSAEIFHFSGIAQAIGKVARKSVLKAARTAKNAGLTVSYDINYRPKLWDRSTAADAFEEVSEYVDTIFVSTEDWHLLYGKKKSAQQVATELRNRGFETVVVKDGSRGSFGIANGNKVSQETFSVDAVDATGAGDAYDAGFLCGTVRGLDFHSAMRYASMNAALKCTRKGGIRGLPTKTQLEIALASHSKK